MTVLPRTATSVLLAAAISLGLAACNRIDDAARDGRGERQVEASPAVPGIPGLDTGQQQAGYAIGLELGGTLAPVRDEIDLDSMLEGIRDALEGSEPRVDEQQFMQIMENLGERMRESQTRAAGAAAEESRAFLAENAQRPEVQVTDSGLQYEVLEPGEGASPGADDRVRVHYEGRLAGGEVFDSSIARGDPAEFPLADVVPGWQEGLQLMSPGGRYRLWIPPALGYGEEGTPVGPIGPNATLEFEVELIEVLDGAD